MFPNNKKGIELSTLAAIILLLVSTAVIAGVYKVAFSKADEKSVEVTCRSFNAVRYGVEKGLSSEGTSGKLASRKFQTPRVCATIEKTATVPTKDFKDTPGSLSVGAAKEIRHMMARCWWMWLEGRQQNMFSKGVFDLKDGCFVCYTFAINKDVRLTYSDILTVLQQPYPQITLADNCKTGGPGTCRANCFTNERESNSPSCKGQKCCIATYSYLDYIQGTNGAPTGKGLVLIGDRDALSSKDLYAVAFVSPKEGWTWEAAGLSTGAAGSAVLAVLVLTAPVSWPVAFASSFILATGSASLYTVADVSGAVKPKDYNFILLDKYQNIQSRCYVEKSYGE
jgi:hypothetical protein